MSYYLDTYEMPILFISGLICLFALLAAYCYGAHWVSKRLRWDEKKTSVLLGIAVFGAGVSFYLILNYLPDYLNDGQIENIYIVKKNNETRLVVWFVRMDTPAGMTTAYSHRIKSYGLHSGKMQGRLTLERRNYFNDYHIYGPFRHHAWGYSAQKGIAFLDVFDADIIADEQTILQQNPPLGDKVRLQTGRGAKRFDAVTFGLYVYTADGDIYRIDPDLKATNVKTLDEGSLKHRAETCAVCRQAAQFKDIEKAASGWVYAGTSKSVLQFVDEGGNVLSQIDLLSQFGDQTYLYATAHVDGEIWLFGTMQRYTLSAVRTDPRTGQILGQVDYF